MKSNDFDQLSVTAKEFSKFLAKKVNIILFTLRDSLGDHITF